MLIEISFRVEWGPTHHDQRGFRKEFDVTWSGSPRPGDEIEVGISPPTEGAEFRVKGIAWSVDGPVSAHLWLEPFAVSLDEFEWQNGFDGFVDYVKSKGWQ